MQRRISTILCLVLISISTSVVFTRANAQAALPRPITLSSGWQLQDVSKIPQNADMVATLDRFTDNEVPVPGGFPVSELRAFYTTWRSDLMTRGTG